MDKNIVILEGVIGTDAKYGKAKNGKEYFTCSLSINAFMKEYADDTERTNSQTYIRLFVYDKRQVAYLRKVNAHQGQRATVFGRLSSCKNEYRGNTFMTMNVITRDIRIIKNKE